MDEGKILIVNLARGQVAFLRRILIPRLTI